MLLLFTVFNLLTAVIKQNKAGKDEFVDYTVVLVLQYRAGSVSLLPVLAPEKRNSKRKRAGHAGVNRFF